MGSDSPPSLTLTPTPTLAQVMVDNFKVGEHTIPKGDVVGLCAPASNLDPRYWSDATEFKPERYLPVTAATVCTVAAASSVRPPYMAGGWV